MIEEIMPAHNILANAGIPFVANKSIVSVLLIIPIILIEGGLIARCLKQSFAKALAVATAANAVSTLAGLGMAVVELVLLSSSFDFSLTVWALELLSGFLVTVLLEFLVLKKALKDCAPPSLWRVVLLSNAITYGLLVIASLVYADITTRGAFDPVIDALSQWITIGV